MGRHSAPGAAVSVLDHINARLAEMDLRYTQRHDAAQKAVEAALAAAEKAVGKAEIAATRRFEAVNEFRGQLADQAGRFLTRDEYEARHQSLAERIAAIKEIVDKDTGRGTGLQSGWGYLIGAVGLISAVIAILVR
jgi:hypothetical protein